MAGHWEKTEKYKFSEKAGQCHSLNIFPVFSEILILYLEKHLPDKNPEIVIKKAQILNHT